MCAWYWSGQDLRHPPSTQIISFKAVVKLKEQKKLLLLTLQTVFACFDFSQVKLDLKSYMFKKLKKSDYNQYFLLYECIK